MDERQALVEELGGRDVSSLPGQLVDRLTGAGSPVAARPVRRSTSDQRVLQTRLSCRAVPPAVVSLSKRTHRFAFHSGRAPVSGGHLVTSGSTTKRSAGSRV